MKNLLTECKLQFEYLNEKFGETGTTECLISRIDGVLSQDGEMPKLFAITTEKGFNEFFWDKDKAQNKIDTEYLKDFPTTEFWVETVQVS